MHSTNSFTISSAVAASTGRLNAITPPNAETGSQARAFVYASTNVSCSAAPPGVLCFTMTAAGLRVFYVARRGSPEFLGKFQPRFEVRQIVVGELLALQLARCGKAGRACP